jgi:hypothetical protein
MLFLLDGFMQMLDNEECLYKSNLYILVELTKWRRLGSDLLSFMQSGLLTLEMLCSNMN